MNSAVSNPLSYKWPIITEKTSDYVANQLKKTISIYNKSDVFEELETKLAAYHGTKYCLLTSSGTAAIHSLFVGINLAPGDEVICPAYTFFATVTPIFQTGAVPVLADIDEFGNIDPDDVLSKITPKTKAIMVTHMWGNPCQMDRLTKIAEDHRLHLLEDGSHAHGALFEGKIVGSFGSGAAFSLQGQKTLTGGEGGFLVTNDESIYHRALLLGHYNKRCLQELPKESPYYDYAVTGMGLKLRAHPLAMAIVKDQLEELPKILEERRAFATILSENFCI